MKTRLYIISAILMAFAAGWMVWVSVKYAEMTGFAIRETSGVLQVEKSDFRYRLSSPELRLKAMGLAEIPADAHGIEVAMPYATPDNFTGEVLYTDQQRAFLQPDALTKLAIAAELLKAQDSTWRLVIFDAARPLSVQQRIWEKAVEAGRTRYVAAPDAGSVHNYGAAVDVTIATPDSLLDMGTAYDHFGPEAEPRHHRRMVLEGKLTEEQVANRLLLRNLMREAGFRAIDTEWWHFNAVSNQYARNFYPLIP